MNNYVVKPLQELVQINSESLTERTEKKYSFKYIDISTVQKGKITLPEDKIQFYKAPSRARRKIQKNDIIMSTVRPNLKAFAYVDFDSKDCICSTGFAVLRAKSDVSIRYVYQMLFSETVETQINNMLVGSNYPAINASDVGTIKIPVPPLTEQEKIADILGCWDSAVEKLTALIDAKKQRKKALMQKLLTAKIRLPGFTDEWKKVEISELLNYEQPTSYLVKKVEAFEKNKIPVLTANKSFTIGSTSDTCGVYDKSICIIFDDFTTDMKFVDFSFKVKSSAIKILTAKSNVNIKFVFEQMSLIKFSLGGHKRYYLSEYQYIPIPIPSFSEQQAIADILSKADEEIDLLIKKLSLFQEQKKGLMQKLLVGQVRVKVV